jgi:hypothetical protein
VDWIVVPKGSFGRLGEKRAIARRMSMDVIGPSEAEDILTKALNA